MTKWFGEKNFQFKFILFLINLFVLILFSIDKR